MRFRWHPSAQVVAADGTRHRAGVAADAALVMPAVPAVAALRQVIGAPAFRIGGHAPAPQPDGYFETLSGGTSGTPRRILRSQQSWIAGFKVNAGLFGIGEGAGVAVVGSLVHSLALYGAAEALHLGAELHLLDGLRPDRQAAALAARRAGLLYATPAQLRLLAAAGTDWPDLRRIVVGGSKLDAPLRAALSARTDARVTEFYGAAETSFISIAGDDTPPDSVGRPYPGVELRFAAGQILVRSPYLAEGYAGPAGSALWLDGWVAPGECGWMENGFLHLSGRASRRVKVADQSVHPEEIEAALLQMPGIEMAAVVARPDEMRGHVLEAFVAGDPAHEAAVMVALRRAFGPLIAPRRLHWTGDWPALPSGKTDLQALAARLG